MGLESVTENAYCDLDCREQIYYKSVLQKHDTDQNGTLDLDELDEMLECGQISEHRKKKIFTTLDTDHDNQLNFDEFRQMFKHRKLGVLFSNYTRVYLEYVVPQKYVKNFHKYDEVYSCWPPPIAILILSIIQIVFFIITKNDRDGSKAIHVEVVFQFDPKLNVQIWRYITYMLIHEGYSHIIYNAVCQIIFGIALELVHGPWRLLILYHIGVLTGALLSYVADPCSILIGASAGTYSLIMAHIATIFMNFKDMAHAFLHLTLMSLLILYDVLMTVLFSKSPNTSTEVSLLAHFGGALTGFLVGIWILRNVDITEKEKIAWWCALIISLLLLGTLITLNIYKIQRKIKCV